MNNKVSNLLRKIRSSRLRLLVLAGLAAPMLMSTAHAAVTFIGAAIINGTGTDQSGLSGAVLEDGVSRNNALNGFGSGLTYAGGNTFYALGDRGPNKVTYPGGTPVDNTISYPNRYEKFQITFTSNGSGGYNVNAVNTGTTLLKNSAGVQYLGISTGFSNDPSVEGHRLDSEAIRVAPDGTTWLSDEYGPYILHFDRSGNEIGHLQLPPGFQVAIQGNASQEAANTSGRVNNQGMEGLAITPDGKTLVGMMQGALIQDGGKSSNFLRVLVYDLTNQNAAPKQYMYRIDYTGTSPSANLPISELLAINNHEFLVDERDANTGATAKKLLYKFDLNQATAPTDLTTSAFPGSTASNGMPTPAAGVAFPDPAPSGIVPLDKTLFADIGSILNTAGIAGGAFTSDSANFNAVLPDKLEGYTWGPDLPDGRHTLLVSNDNDFAQPDTSSPWATTAGTFKGFPDYIWVFAVDPTDVNLTPQTFIASALQNIDHIIVIYQENWPFDGLYGSFPGANGLANASANSKTQINRLTGLPIANDGANAYNNPAFVPSAGQPAIDQVINPPRPLTTDAASGTADSRVAAGQNTLLPYALAQYINPTMLTGDIYHRYWQEHFQIAGTVTGDGSGNDTALGNNQGFVTWSDDPGLVMSDYDATNLPEGLLAQQYTICDNFYHSAFGGSFLNHQFLIAAHAPVYNNMPTSNNGNIAYLDSHGVFVMNTTGSAAGKFVRDGSITPLPNDVLSVTYNGSAATITVGGTSTGGAPQGTAAAYGGGTFDQHYVVNTTRSVNLGGNNEKGIPGNSQDTSTTGGSTLISLMPSQNDSNPSDSTRLYIPTIGDELSTSNVSWKWYSGGWNDILTYSGSNPVGTTAAAFNAVNASEQLQYHHQPFAFYDNYAPFGSSIVPANYVGGFAGTGTGGLANGQTGVTQQQNAAAHLQDEANFFSDVQSGSLPAVSFIKAVGVNNEHPGYAALQTGQAHVASIVQAVQANPALWAHTAIVITYDEHGGRWDHVTPPARDIWGPGERVPCIVISPFAKKGFVNHTQFDTSSILATIEDRFNLNSLNQLDASAPNLFDTFSTLNIAQGSFLLSHATRNFTQSVTVTNIGATTVTGPVQLVLDNLTASSALLNAIGTASDGAPYITVSASDLAPGASATVSLSLKAPTSGGITYSARTASGTATP